MNPEEKRADTPEPAPKAPYERPELKRVGKLRDVTAQAPSSEIVVCA